MESNRLVRSLIFAGLCLIAVAALYPVFFMFLNTFKTTVEYLRSPAGVPDGFYYMNYVAMFNRFSVFRLIFNTFLMAGGSLVISLAICLPASYTFAKLEFPLRYPLYLSVLSMLMIPTATFLIPNYVTVSRLGLMDTYLAVIVIWVSVTIPITVFLLTSVMRGIPNEVLESATIDGAGFLQTLRKIVTPLSKPGIVTVSIFNITGWWNDLLTPLLYLQSDEIKTITVAVATIVGRFVTDIPLLMTGLLFASVVPILMYVMLQRYIREGLIIGAIK